MHYTRPEKFHILINDVVEGVVSTQGATHSKLRLNSTSPLENWNLTFLYQTNTQLYYLNQGQSTGFQETISLQVLNTC